MLSFRTQTYLHSMSRRGLALSLCLVVVAGCSFKSCPSYTQSGQLDQRASPQKARIIVATASAEFLDSSVDGPWTLQSMPGSVNLFRFTHDVRKIQVDVSLAYGNGGAKWKIRAVGPDQELNRRVVDTLAGLVRKYDRK